MKIQLKEKAKVFKPLTVEVTFETEADLKDLDIAVQAHSRTFPEGLSHKILRSILNQVERGQ